MIKIACTNLLFGVCLLIVSGIASAEDVYQMKFMSDPNTYYFTGMKTPTYSAPYLNLNTTTDLPKIYIQYYVKGYTNSEDPNQYKRVPLENIRSAEIERLQSTAPNVFLTEMNGDIIQGVHGYPLCFVVNGEYGTAGCQPGILNFSQSSYKSNKVYMMGFVREIGIITDGQQKAAALQIINKYNQDEIIKKKESERLKIEEEKQRAKEEIQEAKDELANRLALKEAIMKFRIGIKTGDQTNCGLVIQVKKPIAEIQTMIGAHWIRVDELFPDGAACSFVNGIYVHPSNVY